MEAEESVPTLVRISAKVLLFHIKGIAGEALSGEAPSD